MRPQGTPRWCQWIAALVGASYLATPLAVAKPPAANVPKFSKKGGQVLHDFRLGALLSAPIPILAEQLELPRGQGMAVEEVLADSAAAKAGLKAYDIILEIDNKLVSSSLPEFFNQMTAVKANTPVDMIVLRKGRREVIKSLTLPEADAAAPSKSKGKKKGDNPQ